MKRNVTITLVCLFAFLLIALSPAFAAFKEPEEVTFKGRKGWKLTNDKISIIVLEGGGHIVSAKLLEEGAPDVNPFWVPHWKSIEPNTYNAKKHGAVYGDNMEGKLLAGIMGHNLCLDFFGVPSEAEYQNGEITVHGEAPVVKWRVTTKIGTAQETGIIYSAKLPKAQLQVERVILLKAGEPVFKVIERVTNKGHYDRPIGWCEHVTFGAPFVQKGVTLFDAPAYRSAVAPFKFSKSMRYKMGAEYRWPYAPGTKKEFVDARVAADETASSDYSAHLLDPNYAYGYFTAANPKEQLMVGYVWNREIFPWLDNWEENRGRTHKPWNGKEITRGMEFSTTPWTFTRRKTIEQGKYFNTPTYRWIKAGETVSTRYFGFVKKIPESYRGTKNLKLNVNTIDIEGFDGEVLKIPCAKPDNVLK